MQKELSNNNNNNNNIIYTQNKQINKQDQTQKFGRKLGPRFEF